MPYPSISAVWFFAFSTPVVESSKIVLVLQANADALSSVPPVPQKLDPEFRRYTRCVYVFASIGYCCPVFPIGVAAAVPVGGWGVSSRYTLDAAPLLVAENRPLAK